jgi:hypothetical protein
MINFASSLGAPVFCGRAARRPPFQQSAQAGDRRGNHIAAEAKAEGGCKGIVFLMATRPFERNHSRRIATRKFQQ